MSLKLGISAGIFSFLMTTLDLIVLENLGIPHLPILLLSPDLNRIDHMWDMLQGRLFNN